MIKTNDIVTETYHIRDSFYVDVVSFNDTKIAYIYDITKYIKLGMFSDHKCTSEEFLKQVKSETDRYIELYTDIVSGGEFELLEVIYD